MSVAKTSPYCLTDTINSSSPSPFLDFIPTDLFRRILEPHITVLLRERAIYNAMATTNDFGAFVKKLRFSGQTKEKPFVNVLIENVKKIAKTEGFELLLSDRPLYLRDHCVRIDGRTVFSTHSKNIMSIVPQAIDRSFSKAIYFNESGTARSRHPLFWDYFGLSIESHDSAIQDYAKRHGNLAELVFYFEGGNIFTVTNCQGKRTLLIGKGHLAFIHSQWRLAKLFEAEKIVSITGGITQADISKIQSSLTDDSTKKFAEEMYALGLIKNGEGLISFEGIAQLDEIPDHHSCAIKTGRLKPLRLTPSELIAVKPIVAKYLAQREFILKFLADNFGVAVENIHFIPEVNYHLDVFMMPGPNRTIFIQDYELCHTLLTSLKSQAEALGFTPDDLNILDSYLATAQQLHREFGELLLEARREIEKAGLTPIPTPGDFIDSVKATGSVPTHHVRFLNAISGWSEKNGRPYLITTGAQVGHRLGKALMDLFETFLKQYQPDLKVHFVGYKPNAPADFSPAMPWWNAPNGSAGYAGVHCMSIEEEVADHTYTS